MEKENRNEKNLLNIERTQDGNAPLGDKEEKNRIRIMQRDDRRKDYKKFLKLFSFTLVMIAITTVISLLFSDAYFKSKYKDILSGESEKKNNSIIAFEGELNEAVQNELNEKIKYSLGVALYSDDFNYLDMDKAANGILLSDDGNILVPKRLFTSTSNSVFVRVSSGEISNAYGATVLGHDDLTDLTLINSPNLKLKEPKFLLEDNLSLGERVFVVSSPFGEKKSANFLISRVHSKSMPFTVENNKMESKINLIIISSPVYTGNDGAVVYNSRGEIIGITSMYFTEKLKFTGLTAVIPIVELKKVKNRIINRTSGEYIDIGLDGKVIKYEKLGSDRYVYYVYSVAEDSAAKKGGILPTDMILEINGKEISANFDMKLALKGYKTGETVKIKLNRDDEEKVIIMKIY